MKILPINIEGFLNYYVSENGDVYKKNENEVLIKKKTQEDRYGYLYSQFTNINGERKKIKLHRVVAFTFVSNPNNKPTVNHIDGNKKNNNYKNLEWATHKEQTKHLRENGLQVIKKGKENKTSRKIFVFDENLKLIKICYGIYETEEKTGIGHSTIASQLSKKGIFKRKSKFYFSLKNETPILEKQKSTAKPLKELTTNITFDNYQDAIKHFTTTWITIDKSIKLKKPVLSYIQKENGKKEKRFLHFVQI